MKEKWQKKVLTPTQKRLLRIRDREDDFVIHVLCDQLALLPTWLLAVGDLLVKQVHRNFPRAVLMLRDMQVEGWGIG
ncbi:hypothetical protein CDAR_4661 [Caerostris darwini]|uniref:Uncharacterized protein n=1 Tax=Caerostris darwini TaxID=1538125 RepID=A0AAV4P692_9ARAC|nr:hypothetical protein CDAR_4661 [Caerostris darwini]